MVAPLCGGPCGLTISGMTSQSIGHGASGVSAPRPLRPVADMWWLLLLDGLLAAGVGIVLLVWQDRTLALVAGFAGALLIVIGVLGIVNAVRGSDATGSLRRLSIGVAVLAIAVGAFLLVRPDDTVRAVAVAAGIYLV